MQRAATWTEALLDGHFAATPCAPPRTGPRALALALAAAVAGDADRAVLELQGLLGLWAGLARALRTGGSAVRAAAGLYELQRQQL